MNIINLKNVLAGAFGLALFGFSQSAMANWPLPDCDTASKPCIQHNDGPAFNPTDPDESDKWHGVPGTGTPPSGTKDVGADPFEFSGPTNLVCNGIPVDCTLTLYGYVNITPPIPSQTNYEVGVKVVDALVTGGPLSLCPLVEVSGFPWFMGPNDHHGHYNSITGIPYTVGQTPPIDLIASIGPIGVYAPLVTDFSDGHMHDVTYNNLDTFSFGTGSSDPNIYLNGANDDSSGCTVQGDLRLQPAGDTLVIH